MENPIHFSTKFNDFRHRLHSYTPHLWVGRN